MKKEPQNPSERMTLEAWEDKIAKEFGYSDYERACIICADNDDDTIKYKALQFFHDQEMKFMQEDIDRFKSACQFVCKTYEDDGGENMRNRDHYIFSECRNALTSK